MRRKTSPNTTVCTIRKAWTGLGQKMDLCGIGKESVYSTNRMGFLSSPRGQSEEFLNMLTGGKPSIYRASED